MWIFIGSIIIDISRSVYWAMRCVILSIMESESTNAVCDYFYSFISRSGVRDGIYSSDCQIRSIQIDLSYYNPDAVNLVIYCDRGLSCTNLFPWRSQYFLYGSIWLIMSPIQRLIRHSKSSPIYNHYFLPSFEFLW